MNKIYFSAVCFTLVALLWGFAAFADSHYDPRTRTDIPGLVYADSFDNGGEGVAYHDTDGGNNGGFCRTTDVDLDHDEQTGRCYLGWTRTGEWVEYTVAVISAGSYNFDVRVVSEGLGGTFHIEFDGTDSTGPITVPNTGGWQRWKTIFRGGSLRGLV